MNNYNIMRVNEGVGYESGSAHHRRIWQDLSIGCRLPPVPESRTLGNVFRKLKFKSHFICAICSREMKIGGRESLFYCKRKNLCYRCYCLEHFTPTEYLLSYDLSSSSEEEDTITEFEPQALISDESVGDLTNRYNTIHTWLYRGNKYGKSLSSHYLKIPEQIDSHVNLLEDVLLFLKMMISSRNIGDRYLAVLTFCKLRGERIGFTTTLGYIVSDLFTVQVAKHKKKKNDFNEALDDIEGEYLKQFYEPQSDEYDNVFEEARSYINMYDKLKETAIYKKLYKFTLYLLTLGLLKNVNIDFKSLHFSQYEAEAIKRTHKPGFDMVHCMLDTICFVCDRGIQAFKTNDSGIIFHSGSSYEKWIDKCRVLKSQSKLLNNPEPHSINVFQYTAELKEAVEVGRRIIKFTAKLDKFERSLISKTLYDLEVLVAEVISKASCQETREEPFAVCYHGMPSIAKSQLTQITHAHFGKIFKLPIESRYLYTRCPADQYWSNYDSSQWHIVMDDIAWLKPNGEVDPSLTETLQVINSVPYTPPQAELADKGRTPIRARLVTCTTNTKKLNLHAYFSCPFAVARRLKYVVSAKVKPQYAKNKVMLDSSKVPILNEGEYMNVWDFEVSTPVPEVEDYHEHMGTKYKVIASFTDINDYLAWLIARAKEHHETQTSAMAASKTMYAAPICDICYRTNASCTCFIPQSDVSNDDDFPRLDDLLENFQINEEFVNRQPLQNGIEEDSLSSYNVIFKCKLWLISKIVAYEKNEMLYVNSWLYFLYLNWKLCVVPNVLCFYLQPVLYIIYLMTFVCLYFFCMYFWIFLAYYCMFTYGGLWKYKLGYKVCGNDVDTIKFIFRTSGERIKNRFADVNLKMLSAFCASAAVLLIARQAWNKYMNKMHPQNFEGSVPKHLPVEKPTFYYNNPYVNTNLEISDHSKTAQGDVLKHKIERNLAVVDFRFPSRPGKVYTTTALNIKGNVWIFNKHVLHDTHGTVAFIFDKVLQNVSRNTPQIAFDGFNLRIYEDTDIVFLEVKSVTPGRNLVPYFAINTIQGNYNGEYIMQNRDGVKFNRTVNCISYGHCEAIQSDGYYGKVITNTVKGDCGSPLLVYIGNAQVILGIHGSGDRRGGIFCVQITQGMLEKGLKAYDFQPEVGELVVSAPGFKHKIGPVHTKNSVRFIPSGTAEVIGSYMGYNPTAKSRVKKSLICDTVVKYGYKDDCGPPSFHWKAWNRILNNVVQPNYMMKASTLRECSNAYISDVLERLGDKVKMLEIYDMETVLNGVDGIAYVDRINVHTSAGLPFRQPKKKFLEMTDEGKITVLSDIIKERIKQIEYDYDNGVMAHPISCMTMKDEPTKYKKIDIHKTRGFAAAEMAFSLVSKKYNCSFNRLMQNNPYAFESMIGVVAQSDEWATLYAYLNKYTNHIDGDFENYDAHMVALVVMEVYYVKVQLARAAGWSEEAINILWLIGYDTAYTFININGLLVLIQMNPSGNTETVNINCIANSLYMRFAWRMVSGLCVTKFRDYVNLATYGDDNDQGVSDLVPSYNHNNIAQALATVGIKYTMADKSSFITPYRTLDKVSFLKRRFVFDKDFDSIVAPLDHSSIDKMLTSFVDTGTQSHEAQAVVALETALREYAFYGRDEFIMRKILFQEIIAECDLGMWVRASTFPSFASLVRDYWYRSGKPEKAAERYNILILQEEIISE